MIDENMHIIVTIKLCVPLDVAAQLMSGEFKIMSLERKDDDDDDGENGSFEFADVACSISKSDKSILDKYLEDKQRKS